MILSKINLTDLLRDFPALFNHNVDLTALKSELISQAELNVIRNNIILNAFRFAILDGVSAPLNYEYFSLDEYETEEKIDTENSINQLYDVVGNYYRPTGIVIAEYDYRKAITIDRFKVEAAHQNFPMLFSVIDANLKTIGNGGKVENANGYDIIFTSDAEGLNQLDHEIEKYDGATGEFIAWVRIPSFTGYTKTDIEDLEIYLFYGNSEITESQENVAAVWDSNFVMVQHLKNDPDNAHTKDSTINANNGTKKGPGEPLEVDGIIGKAQSFDGINDYVEVPDDDSLDFGSGPFTFESWVKGVATGDIVSIFERHYSSIWIAGDLLTGYLRVYIGGAGPKNANIDPTNLTDNERHYVVIRRDNNSVLYFYVDTKKEYEEANVTGSLDSNYPLVIGGVQSYQNAFFWSGLIDEGRISNIARSPEWIKTSYNSESDPATFFSMGIQEAMIIGYYNMTLISKNSVADFEPSEVRKVIRIEPMEEITLNTDLEVWVTKEGADLGTATWEQVIVESMGEFGSLKTVIKGTKAMAATGTKDMRYMIKTPTGKDIRIHGDAFQLKE